MIDCVLDTKGIPESKFQATVVLKSLKAVQN